jgi:Fic family protein
VYARLATALEDLDDHGGLPRISAQESVWSDIWRLETHHSTAVEGNTLTAREVRELLDRGRAVGARPLRDYLEVQGYAAAATWVYEQAHLSVEPTEPLLTVHDVRHVHHLAMAPVWDSSTVPRGDAAGGPGNYRRHDIQPFAFGMTPPTWPLVPGQIENWVAAAGERLGPGRWQAADNTHLPESLATLHAEFERIHPFLDGNGRAGRLLINLILARNGCPPAVIVKRQRDAYMRALHQADIGNPGPLGELIARAVLDTASRFILSRAAPDDRYLPLVALADDEIGTIALRAAARRGRLTARQDVAGQWLATRAAVAAYKASRRHHGRRAARTDQPKRPEM